VIAEFDRRSMHIVSLLLFRKNVPRFYRNNHTFTLSDTHQNVNILHQYDIPIVVRHKSLYIRHTGKSRCPGLKTLLDSGFRRNDGPPNVKKRWKHYTILSEEKLISPSSDKIMPEFWGLFPLHMDFIHSDMDLTHFFLLYLDLVPSILWQLYCTYIDCHVSTFRVNRFTYL
jgi:hypothetical protein